MRPFDIAVAAAFLAAGATPSFAEYPDHPIEIVVPYTPGWDCRSSRARAGPQAYRRVGPTSRDPQPAGRRR